MRHRRCASIRTHVHTKHTNRFHLQCIEVSERESQHWNSSELVSNECGCHSDCRSHGGGDACERRKKYNVSFHSKGFLLLIITKEWSPLNIKKNNLDGAARRKDVFCARRQPWITIRLPSLTLLCGTDAEKESRKRKSIRKMPEIIFLHSCTQRTCLAF